jgi:hypothetical protein
MQVSAVSWQDHGKCVLAVKIGDFLQCGGTSNAEYYSRLLCSYLYQLIQKKKTWETVKEEHPTA